jgi:hypothetical protein
VGFRQQICPDLLVGGDRVTRQTAGAVDFAGMEPKQMSTGGWRRCPPYSPGR